MANERIKVIVDEALSSISAASTSEELQELRNKYLSKKSELMSLMSTLGQATPDERKELGREVNLAKEHIAKALE